MQELKKILEEINYRINEYVDHDYVRGSGDVVKGLSIAKSIVRKHMNDGWIPVEERLPNNNENVLVATDMGLITSGYIAHGTWITDQEPDYPIAWRPLPEPYRPERSVEE